MKRSLKRKGLMLAILAMLALGATGCPFMQQHPVHPENRGHDGDRNDHSRSYDQDSHDHDSHDQGGHDHDNKHE